MLAGSQPKSPGRPPLDSIEAQSTSIAAIARPICTKVLHNHYFRNQERAINNILRTWIKAPGFL